MPRNIQLTHQNSQPGLAGCRRSAHTINTPQNPRRQLQGAAETQTQVNTPTPHTLAGTRGVQAERAHKDTRPNTPARIGGVKAKTRTDTHTH